MKKTGILGFLMIEVLLSLFIISMVFLSLLAYQIALLKNTEALHFKTIATQQLLNFSEIVLFSKNTPLRKTLFSKWNRDNAAWLPQGIGIWSDNNQHDCHIQLQWLFKQKELQALDVYC
ncbi:MAG: hypothetical protein Q8L78_03295 [Coxiellaceae bacterium]|nr:hypothetical protein [Coxiellaceae bacterium]